MWLLDPMLTSRVVTACRDLTPSLLSLSSAVRWVSKGDVIPPISGQLGREDEIRDVVNPLVRVSWALFLGLDTVP